jgi:hypothetical protein
LLVGAADVLVGVLLIAALGAAAGATAIGAAWLVCAVLRFVSFTRGSERLCGFARCCVWRAERCRALRGAPVEVARFASAAISAEIGANICWKIGSPGARTTAAAGFEPVAIVCDGRSSRIASAARATAAGASRIERRDKRR